MTSAHGAASRLGYTRRVRSLRTFVSAAATLCLTACGAAPRPASAPSSASAPSTIEEAEAELDRAERLLPGSPSPDGTGARAEEKPAAKPKDVARPPAPTGGAAPAPTTASTPMKAAARDEPARPVADDGEEATPCQTACRALASMRRAADAVCRIAGEGDARCAGAHRRVEAALARVAHCGCSP